MFTGFAPQRFSGVLAVLKPVSAVSCQMCINSWKIESRHESKPNMAGLRAFHGKCIRHDWSMFLYLSKPSSFILISWYILVLSTFMTSWYCSLRLCPSPSPSLVPTQCGLRRGVTLRLLDALLVKTRAILMYQILELYKVVVGAILQLQLWDLQVHNVIRLEHGLIQVKEGGIISICHHMVWAQGATIKVYLLIHFHKVHIQLPTTKAHFTTSTLKLFQVHLKWLSNHLNKDYFTNLHIQFNKALLLARRVNQTLVLQPLQGAGSTTVNTANPTSSMPSLTMTQLEQRLEEVMDKKLESMTKALRSSMASVAEPQPPTSPTIQDPNLVSNLQQTQEESIAQTLVHGTSTGQEAQHHDMLTSKAKPPIKPEETTSIRRSTRGRSRDHSRSPRHSERQPLPRYRGRSYQSQREDSYIPTSHSHTPPGHRERSGPHDRIDHRGELPDWASMSSPHGERNRSHPIYQRSNAIRARSSNAGSWHQIHADANTTVFARSSEDFYHRESRHRQDRQNPSITLRSRSRSRRSRAPHRAQPVYHGKGTGIHLHPRPHHHHGSTRQYPHFQEVSQSEAESAQVTIPPPDAVEQPDWGRSSQERERPGTEAPEDDDQLMAIPKTQSLDADWKTSVEKAFNDITRTKAPCEISADLTCKLISTVNKKQYQGFVKLLQDRNPTVPREVVGNMATIFAQSGKMDMKQAEGSSTFEVPHSLGYGLFVPTYFKTKPPFQNNDSNVYHILHGTTNKGASLILAEELIRPGDFTIHKNPAKCGYPSYGYYSAGEVAAKTVPFYANIKELSRKILKIGKGVLPLFIGGIYMGRNPHINQLSGGNDEIQRLCGEHGAARGKEKYLVARSEHTTVHGVVITFKNAIEVQPTRS